MPHALIVEDDPDSLSGLAALLAADGFSVDTATSLAEARAALGRSIPDVALVDLNLPDGSGFDLLQHLPPQQDGSLPVIALTGNATVESAIEGLRHGIWDYLVKPINIPRLRSLLARIPRPSELIDEVQSLRASLRSLGRFGAMVGRSDAMQQVYDLIEQNARTEETVLLTGEAGTGKEIAARTLHDLSRRSKGPFVAFDCRSLAHAERHGAALGSVLFGHERGAFDGAERREPGLFEQAGGGTLFLDEIAALPLVLQEALLHALDLQSFMRVGGTTPIPVDFRLIATTRRPAREAVAHGTLREDLWLRLGAASIALPPLRERDDDALHIADALIDALNRAARATGRGTTDKRAAPGFVRECLAYEWPGNVRELQERVRAAYDASGDFVETLRGDEAGIAAGAALNGSSVQIKVGTPLADVEDLLIRATLDAVGGTRHRAATLLGISPKTLYNKLQRMKTD
ncbi:two component, sigma54 specific, transcriptional regulator, Fis family [Burkholderia sp. lig30]|jgi:DNA-binding NtrC family response regulator|uniref:sigma-54-dependent transcriptional regulator n=1 Tax=Burkholderia sp. lig30 TaxID=1192124 RepID=UPI0004617305|nr:sigma-54 dependent transcriptional regulator [Burkholderia sp. lig30]KDB08452.1 two component, sigma54 specific, transcriptional regulator, Fis family [Burkholderia sp. lig30]